MNIEGLSVQPLIPKVSNYKTIVKSKKSRENYWVGAPSVVKDFGKNIWLTYRVREPKERGTEVRICKSKDGYHFETVKVIKKEEVNAKSLERSSLIQDPRSGMFKLFLSPDPNYDVADPQALGWHIVKLEDVSHPQEFDPESAKVVISPSGVGTESGPVKDPYVINIGWKYYMFYTAKDGGGEQAHLATSIDGDNWSKKVDLNPVISRGGWHNFHTRAACVLPVNNGLVIYYEGTNRQWYQPMYNVLTGVATSLDLKEFTDVTPDEPLLSSPTKSSDKLTHGYQTLRYMDYVQLKNKLLFYYEAACEDGSFELRVTPYEFKS